MSFSVAKVPSQVSRLQEAEVDFIAKAPVGYDIRFPTILERIAAVCVSTFFYLSQKFSTTFPFALRTKEWLYKREYFSPVTIQTADGVKLDAVIKRSSKNTNRAVLVSLGLGDQFESLADPASLAFAISKFVEQKLGDVTFLAFNVRGKRDSTGYYIPRFFDLDVFSAYQYLMAKERFHPKNIIGYGHSLGAHSLLRGAHLLQKEYPDIKLKLIADRTFYSMSEVIAARFGTGLIGKAITWLASSCGWDVTFKGCESILSSKTCAIVSLDDQTIPFHTAFSNRVDLKTHEISVIEMPCDGDGRQDTHIDALARETEDLIVRSILR